jgi:hypothetical protein
MDLVDLAQQFNAIAQQTIGRNPQLIEAAQKAFTTEVADALQAIDAEAAPFAAEQQEALAVLKANQPQQDIPDELREALTQAGFGDQLPPKKEGPAPAIDEAAVAAAQAKLEALNDKIAPIVLKQAEVLAGIAATVLGDTFNKIVPPHVRSQDISEGFTANNAPTLARAFTPAP